MGNLRMEKFADASAFRCPLCGGGMAYDAGSLRCGRGHCFDVSKKGYVSFLPGQKPLRGYDRAFFEARRRVMDAGLYAHVNDAVIDALVGIGPGGRVIDAGCGEGTCARAVREKTGADVLALDAAPDAIRTAAAGGSEVRWLVADLAAMPVADACADAVLNVYTPANYAEFRRVLRRGGRVIKVSPGPAHLAELRDALGDRLRGGFDSRQVPAYTAEHLTGMTETRVTRTFPLTDALRPDLLRMTPMMFGREGDVPLREMTIDAIVMTGTPV